MSRFVKRMSAGQKVTGQDYNNLLDLINSERIAAVGPGITISKNAAGVSLNVDISLRKSRAMSGEYSGTNDTASTWFFGRIESYAIHGGLKDPQSVDQTDATNHINVYKYAFVEVGRRGTTDSKPFPASSAWGALTYGKSGYLYNLIELNNPGYQTTVDTSTSPPTATGTYGKGRHGNGVDTTGVVSTTGMEIQPIPVGTIVIVYPLQTKLLAGTITEYYTQYENGLDGTCS